MDGVNGESKQTVWRDDVC